MISMTIVNRSGETLWSGKVPAIPREGDEIETSIPSEDDATVRHHGVVRKVSWRFIKGMAAVASAKVVVG